MKDHERERNIAAQNRGRLSIAQKQLKTLQWEHEVGQMLMWKVDEVRQYAKDTLGIRMGWQLVGLGITCADSVLGVQVKVGGIRNVGWRQSAYTLAPSSNPVSPTNIHTPGSTHLLPCNSH